MKFGGQGQVIQFGGERDHRRHLELLGQLHGIAVVAIVGFPDLASRMERVAVAGEGADLQSTGGNGLLEALPRRVVGEQGGGIGVGVARITADPDLDCLTARSRDVVQRLFERALAEEHRKDPDFHVRIHSFLRLCLTGSAHAEHDGN